jgi:hypothetical protein
MKDEEKIELYRTAMLDALGKAHCGRLEDRMVIITELADVTIMMEPCAACFGWDEYVREKESSND